jgi:hypothetical protein
MWRRDKKIVNYLSGVYRLGGGNIFPNDAYISGVTKRVFSGGGQGNVGTGLDTLFSFNFPQKVFKTDFDYFRAVIVGQFGSNDDNKRLAWAFDSTTLHDTGLIDIDGNGFWLELFGQRQDQTHAQVTSKLIVGSLVIDSAGGITSSGMKTLAVNGHFFGVQDFLTGTGSAILVTGESSTATNNNVFVSGAIVELNRA